MTIQVNLPDGSVVNFPDGTPQEEMESALAAHTGPAPSPQMQSNLSQLSAMTQDPKAGMAAAAPGAANQRAVNEYDAMPGWKRAATTLVDLPGLIANGATFGNLDELAAGARSKFLGTDYEKELATLNRQTEDARARQGWAGTGAEILGSIGTGGAAAKGVGTVAKGLAKGVVSPNVINALTTVAPNASKARKAVDYALRTGLAVGEGAAQGAATAHGEGQDMGQGALYGGLFGAAAKPVADLVTGGVSKVAGMFNPKEVAPTLQKINSVKKGLYDIAEKAGVIIKPEGMKKILDDAEATFTQYDSELQTGAAAVLRKIRERQGQNLTLKGLDEIRKMAGNAYQGAMAPNAKTNNTAVSELVKHIDDLIEGADPNFIAGVDTEVGAKALKAAREVAHRGFKLDTAQKLLKRATGQSESNITDTTVRSAKKQLAKINDPFLNWGRGYTAVEKAAAAKAAAYTGPQRVMHNLSALNPFAGGKLNAMAGVAALGPNAFFLGLPGLGLQAAAGVGGYAAGKYGEHLAKKSVNEFLDTVARGGVPAPQIENAIQKMAKSKQDAVRRALMSGMNQQYNQPAER